jgi:hypothetical protein
VAEERKGYLEDRRPSSNCDPYQVTYMHATCMKFKFPSKCRHKLLMSTFWRQFEFPHFIVWKFEFRHFVVWHSGLWQSDAAPGCQYVHLRIYGFVRTKMAPLFIIVYRLLLYHFIFVCKSVNGHIGIPVLRHFVEVHNAKQQNVEIQISKQQNVKIQISRWQNVKIQISKWQNDKIQIANFKM